MKPSSTLMRTIDKGDTIMNCFKTSFSSVFPKGPMQRAGDCLQGLLFLFFYTIAFFAQAQADLPNPPANLQTATKGSLVIPMDNVYQAVIAPFNLKAYGLVNALLQNNIPVKWIIRSGKVKDTIDFTAAAERLYPSFIAAASIDFRSSAFIIDSAYVNNSYYGFGLTATQVITSFGNSVAVYRLTNNVTVDVRYVLTQHPKIAVFNNGGNQALHTKILDAASFPDYEEISAGVFNGLAACYTFCSEAHWHSTNSSDSAITNRVRSFVLSGGNFLAQCYGVDTYEKYDLLHSTKGTSIRNSTVTNDYYNPDMAFMQFMGTIVSNQGGAERNWIRKATSAWISGFYYCISKTPEKDTVVAGAAHLTAGNKPGGNVFYLGGHDYFDNGAPDWTDITHINAARLYLNAALIPSDRPSAFVANAGINKTICTGQAVSLGGTPTGPAGSTYIWQPGKSMNDSTVSNPVATPTVTTTYGVNVNNGGCPQVSQVTVTVNPLPLANAGTNITLCPGNAVASLNGSVTNAGGGIWSGGAGAFNPNNTTLNATYTPTAAEIAGGSVTLTLTTTGAGACTPATSQVTITITPALTAVINTTTTVCYGKTATLTATAGGGTSPYGYTWSSAEITKVISNKTPGTYTVTVTDATNKSCTKTAAVTIAEDPQLSVSTSSNNVATCTSNANISATGVGGNGGFTYLWSTGQTVNTINVNTGSYTVTITDAAGCTVTDAILVKSAVNGTLAANINPPADACYGGGTSTVTVVATGGFGMHTYSWSNGQTGTSITVGKGTYCVIVKDSIGCIVNACGTVKEEPQMSVAITPTLICTGSTAVIIATVTGGTAAYTYAWSTGEATSSISRPAGTYSLTVTDANTHNCTVAASITVLQSPVMTLTSGSIASSCKGNADGVASISVSGGGTSPFVYSWSPTGGTSNTTVNVAAGTYIVTVTDKVGCTSTKAVVVNEPSVVSCVTSIVNAVSCKGGNDGSAVVAVAGGTPGYSYVWSTGATAITVSGLVKGAYIVTVTDLHGCTAFSNVVITEPVVLSATAATAANVSCNGGNNGTAVATPAGGNGVYTYSWAPAGGTGMTGTGLPAGVYTVTVTDKKGCTAVSTGTITEPTVLAGAGATSVNVKCFGASTGSAFVSASGGKPAYKYLWSPSGGTGLTAVSLSAGTYTISITDANNCVKTVTASVTQPPQLTVQASPTSFITCDSTVIISGVANGGTGAYSYSWNTGKIASVIVVNSGHYSVVVKDVNGCTAMDTVSVVALNSTLDAAVTAPLNICSGTTVNITVNVTPGVSPYLYSWNTGQTTPSITAKGGSHCATVTDKNNCKVTACVNIVEDSIQSISIPVDTLCFGASTTLTANVNGGTGPFTYSWSTGEAVQTISRPAGTYIVTVTDAISCALTASVKVVQSTDIVISFANSLGVTCNGGNNGIAQATVTGGKPVYTYRWSTNDTISSVDALTAGTYTVTITDRIGCTKVGAAIITEPLTALTLDSVFTNITCFGLNNGTATITASGGTTPYTYSWLTSGHTTPVETGLKPGMYYANVTDKNHCFAANIITITEPPVLTLAASSINDVSCKGGNDGKAAALITGGTAAFTYSWSPGGFTGVTNNNIVAGIYTVTVTDAGGCSLSSFVTITEPPVLSNATFKTDVLCNGALTGSATVFVSGGNTGYTYSWTPPASTGPSAVNIAATNYTVQVTDSKGCTTSTTFAITQPPALALTPSSTIATCSTANGTAHIAVTGGNGSYTYSWSASASTGSTGATLAGVFAGTYTVLVTDANACTATSSVAVVNISGPVASASTTTDATCFAKCNGTAKASATAGSPPYTYSWSSVPAQAASSATGLCAGNYYVKVSDSNTCVDSVLVTIKEPAVVSVIADTVVPLCIGQSTTLTVKTTGGTGAYTYSWLPAGPTVSPTATKTYTVTAKDVNGCTSASVSVTVPVNPPISLSANDTSLCFGSTGIVKAAGIGGNGNFSYTWMPGPLTTQSITATPGATYTVTVNDGCGTPSVSKVLKVGTDSLAKIKVTPDMSTGCTPLCVQFANTSSVTNGTITGWIWDFGDTTAISTDLSPLHCFDKNGIFSVGITAITNKGCTSKITYKDLVTAHGLPNATFSLTPGSVSILDGEVHFDNYVYSNVVSWKWDFGDKKKGDTSNIKAPIYQYSDTGTYCARLIVKNQYGCIDSSTRCLYVYPEYAFYVPNAFTPNDDWINDKFGGVGLFVKRYEMWIFDRWGGLIFKSEDITRQWDGIANYGYVPAQQDVYVYKILVNDYWNNEHKYIGHVTLVK